MAGVFLHIVAQPILDEQVRDALHALPGKPRARAICSIVSGASSIARRPPMTVMLKGHVAAASPGRIAHQSWASTSVRLSPTRAGTTWSAAPRSTSGENDAT